MIAGALDRVPSSWIESRPQSEGFRFFRRILWGRADAASRILGGLAGGAPVLQHAGAIAVGANFSPLVEQTPHRCGDRRRSRPDARDRRRLVLLLSLVHRRGLPSGSTGRVQPQTPRRRAWPRLPLLSSLRRDISVRRPDADADLHEL